MDREELSVFVFILLVATLVGSGLSHSLTTCYYKREAVKRGFAEYHPTTGDWGWKELQTEETAK